jgi:hypothetical protein
MTVTSFGPGWRVDYDDADERHAHGSRLLWRADRYEVRDGALWETRPVGGRIYAPMPVADAVTNALAGLRDGDEPGTLAFATTYGLLGRRALMRPGPPEGEPLAWVWAHARTVRVCLAVTAQLHALGRPGSRANRQRLGDLRAFLATDVVGATFGEQARTVRPTWTFLEPGSDPRSAMTTCVVCQRLVRHADVDARGRCVFCKDATAVPHRTSPRVAPPTAPDPVADARFVRRTLINANLAGIGRRVVDDGDRDATVFGFRCLLDVVYWRLASAVEARPHGAAGTAQVVTCAAPDCGRAFVRRDPRQRFCPGVDGTESRCAQRARQQRCRRA